MKNNRLFITLWTLILLMLPVSGMANSISSLESTVTVRDIDAEQNGNKRKITGKVVSEDGEVLPGVHIIVKGTNVSTTSDMDGNFTIAVDNKSVLHFSFVGMTEMDIRVTEKTPSFLVVTMASNVELMDEVVVTGYQTLSKERSTGSYSLITSKKLENKLQNSITSVLEGQSAGVVINKDGEIEIRGISTINGVTAPLIVVDGYPLIGDGVGIETVNPDNIENITVLKDAVAASIYGSRASNGVIVITTKSAKKGALNINYKGTYGVTLKPDLSKLNSASTEDYMDAERELYAANQSYYQRRYNNLYRNSDYIYLLVAKDLGLISEAELNSKTEALKQNNALREIEKYMLRPKQSQQHNLSLSSSSETNVLNTALRYTKNYHNLKNNDDERFIFDISNTWKPKDWISVRTYANVNLTQSNTTVDTYQSLTAFESGSLIYPYSNLYDDNGNPILYTPVGHKRLDTYNTYPGMKSVSYHPEIDLPLNAYKSEKLQLRMGGDINVKFCNFLSGSVGGTYIKGSTKNTTIYDGESFTMRTSYNDGTSCTNPSKHYIPEGGWIDEDRGSITSWVIRGQLNYKQSFDNEKHRVSAIAGSEISKDTYEITYLPTRVGYNPVFGTYDSSFPSSTWANEWYNDWGDYLFQDEPDSDKGDMFYTVSPGANYRLRDNRFVSWYGNASYEYNNKYIVTGSVRLDLTNFFGTDPKYRYKPTWSVGGTWKLGDEEFFGLKDIFNRLNVRASYGINGNISLDYTPYLILSVGSHNATMGGPQYGISQYPNDQLRWEKTHIINLGLDFSMLNNRINTSFDYYYKKSKDLIASDAVDATTGVSSLPQNVGEVTNKGIELTVSADIIRNKDFKWNSSLIVSHNISKVDKFNVNRKYFSSYAISYPIMVENYPMDGFWGCRYAGLSDKGTTLYYNKDGEIVDGGMLTVDDAVFLGTARPKWDLSWTNSFTYKNWEASMMFIAKLGHKYRKNCFYGSNYNNKYVGQRWRKPGDEEKTIYPALIRQSADGWYFPYSDIMIGNASYLKLRDFTLSYNLPRDILNGIGIAGAKVYFQTRNLFYITAKGVDIDPETAEYDRLGMSGLMNNPGYTSLQLRPEFYFGVSINL